MERAELTVNTHHGDTKITERHGTVAVRASVDAGLRPALNRSCATAATKSASFEWLLVAAVAHDL
jgi:hypothetical protein